MPRRRGVARTSAPRRRTYRTRTKWDPKVMVRRFKVYMPWMIGELIWELEVLMLLEEDCFGTLQAMGVPTDLWEYYVGFSKRVWERRVHFNDATFQLEKTSVVNEYTMRGLNPGILALLQIHSEYWGQMKNLYPLGLLPEADQLYAGYEGSPGDIDVARVDLLTFTKAAERTDIPSGFNRLVPRLYSALGWANPGVIKRLDPATLATLGTLTFDAGEYYIWGFAQRWNQLYAGMSEPSGSEEIIRCTKRPLAKDAKLAVGEGINGTLVISGNTMYDITAMEAGSDKVVKIDLSSFTKGPVLALGQLIDDGLSADAAISEGYLYVGVPTTPGRIVKIDLATFTVDSTLTLAADEAHARGLVVKDGYLYVGCWESPAKIVKIDLATFTEVATLTLASGENNAYDLVTSGDLLYVLCYDYYLVRVDLPTFTRIDSLNLGAGAVYATDLIGV